MITKVLDSLLLNKKSRMLTRVILISLFFLFKAEYIQAQGCCSGGSGSPIAGGSSPGVLAFQQMEIATNFQYINSNRFKSKDKDVPSLFDNYSSSYLYSKIAYGLTKELTFSVEMGYFTNKTQVGLNKGTTISTSGIGDLIIFPRYNVYTKVDSTKRWDITLGMGYKIPLGKDDIPTLVYTNPVTGEKLYTTAPPLVQPSTGSHDFIIYGFVLRGFPKRNFKMFANATYIAKGWNSLGEKFGNYASLGLFASKTIRKKTTFILQLRGDQIGKMRAAKNVDLLAMYNVDTASTGNKRITLVPQISYSFKNLTIFGLYEIPIYEYVYGSQVVTKTQVTVGLSYRFFTTKNPVCAPEEGTSYYECEMKCEGGRSDKPGKCRVCGMDLHKVSK